ncbi:MAG: hypothetical protein ACLQT7_09680 [Candidatus Dormibacteria bacterium]
MARRLRALASVAHDLVIGDDWGLAAGMLAALALTAGISRTAVPSWWVLPAAVLLLLPLSVWRTARHRG